jgi:hypothetical protein
MNNQHLMLFFLLANEASLGSSATSILINKFTFFSEWKILALVIKVWMWERPAGIDPHMLAVLSSAPNAPATKLTVVVDHLKLYSWQWAWALLSSFTNRSWAVSRVVKTPLKFKKTYGDLRSCRSSDEMLEKRLELCPQKGRRLFLCLRQVLASKYSARMPFLRVYIVAFLKRFATRRYFFLIPVWI